MTQARFNDLLPDGLAQELGQLPLEATSGLFDVKIADTAAVSEHLLLGTDNFNIYESVIVSDSLLRAVPYVRIIPNSTVTVSDVTLAEKNIFTISVTGDRIPQVIVMNDYMNHFLYKVKGTESDPRNITIWLPEERLNSLYVVNPDQELCANTLLMNVDSSSKTSQHFILSLSAPATVNDVFSFEIADITV